MKGCIWVRIQLRFLKWKKTNYTLLPPFRSLFLYLCSVNHLLEQHNRCSYVDPQVRVVFETKIIPAKTGSGQTKVSWTEPNTSTMLCFSFLLIGSGLVGIRLLGLYSQAHRAYLKDPWNLTATLQARLWPLTVLVHRPLSNLLSIPTHLGPSMPKITLFFCFTRRKYIYRNF